MFTMSKKLNVNAHECYSKKKRKTRASPFRGVCVCFLRDGGWTGSYDVACNFAYSSFFLFLLCVCILCASTSEKLNELANFSHLVLALKHGLHGFFLRHFLYFLRGGWICVVDILQIFCIFLRGVWKLTENLHVFIVKNEVPIVIHVKMWTTKV